MNILVTGSNGFIGKNLVHSLYNIKEGKDKRFPNLRIDQIFKYDKESSIEDLEKYCQSADYVFNLAGINRPQKNEEFMKGNCEFGKILLDNLKKHKNNCPVMLSSSAYASLEGRYKDSEYGKSKLAGEQVFIDYAKETNNKISIYRFPNVFGKWCKPNYNSVIATFCYNIANGREIMVNDATVELELLYIDDLIFQLILGLQGNECREGYYCKTPITYKTTLGFIAETIQTFPVLRQQFMVPSFSNKLVEKLYDTWLSYLPEDKIVYDLETKEDYRGSFTEILKTFDNGQFSINISKPGIVKGNHWHHSKNEKFIVVSGNALIQMRKIGLTEEGKKYPILEFYVSDKNFQVVDIPTGYTHNITNLSKDKDLITIIWANELFDSNRPDTYFEEV